MKKLLALILLAASLCVNAQDQPNTAGTALTESARTAATVNSADIQNPYAQGCHVIINTTVFNSGVYTPKLQGKTTSGLYYDILIGTGSNTVTATGAITLKAFPGAGAIAGGATNDILPAVWRVQMNGTSTPSATFSVDYNCNK